VDNVPHFAFWWPGGCGLLAKKRESSRVSFLHLTGHTPGNGKTGVEDWRPKSSMQPAVADIVSQLRTYGRVLC
jgi:hypothetical protein